MVSLNRPGMNQQVFTAENFDLIVLKHKIFYFLCKARNLIHTANITFLFIIQLTPYNSPSFSGCVHDDKAKEDHNLHRCERHNNRARAEKDD